MSNIKCEVARDLMPLMADDVASPASVDLVNEHMESCETCKAYYDGMKAVLLKNGQTESDQSFVQFAKKEKKWFRNRKRIIRTLIATLLAIVIAIIGIAVVDNKMNMLDTEMDIDHASATPFAADDGTLGLLINMEDGYGWYWRYHVAHHNEVYYIMPREPEWKLWNRGSTGTVPQVGIGDLYIEDGKVYVRYLESDVIYDTELGIYRDEWTVHKNPIKYICWGTYDNFETIYEEGDVILSYEDIVNGAVPEYTPSAAMVPRVTPVVKAATIAPTEEATLTPTPEVTAKPTATAKPAA